MTAAFQATEQTMWRLCGVGSVMTAASGTRRISLIADFLLRLVLHPSRYSHTSTLLCRTEKIPVNSWFNLAIES